jgi:hypothetical protein
MSPQELRERFGQLLGQHMRAADFKDTALGAEEGIGVSGQAIHKWRTGVQIPGELSVLDRIVVVLGLKGSSEREFRDAYMRARDSVVADYFEQRIAALQASHAAEVDRYEERLKDKKLGKLQPEERDLLWKLREIEPGAARATWTLLARREAIPLLRAVVRVVEGPVRSVNGFVAKSPNHDPGGAGADRFFGALEAVARVAAPGAVDNPKALRYADGDPEGLDEVETNQAIDEIVARLKIGTDEVP